VRHEQANPAHDTSSWPVYSQPAFPFSGSAASRLKVGIRDDVLAAPNGAITASVLHARRWQ
jgi:hypothetical protein